MFPHWRKPWLHILLIYQVIVETKLGIYKLKQSVPDNSREQFHSHSLYWSPCNEYTQVGQQCTTVDISTLVFFCDLWNIYKYRIQTQWATRNDGNFLTDVWSLLEYGPYSKHILAELYHYASKFIYVMLIICRV